MRKKWNDIAWDVKKVNYNYNIWYMYKNIWRYKNIISFISLGNIEWNLEKFLEFSELYTGWKKNYNILNIVREKSDSIIYKYSIF